MKRQVHPKELKERQTTKKKPKGTDKGDEDLEVLDLTADVSGGEDKEVVRIRILKYDFGPEPEGKKGGKKKQPCLRTMSMLENDVKVGGPLWCWMAAVLLKLGPRPDQFTS